MNGLAIASEKISLTEAIKAYLEIVCKNLKSTNPITNIALILEEDMGNIELAGIFYEVLYRTNNKSVSAVFNFANYLRRYKKDLVMAEQLLIYVNDVMSKSDIVMMTFALLFFQRCDYIACKKKLDEILELFPEYESAYLLRNIIEYYIDGNRSKKILKQMKKISGSSNMERMLQYIFETIAR